MRVVWISHRAGLGGAELALVEAVAALGEPALVVLPWEGPLRERLEAAGARVVVVPLTPWAGRGGGRLRRSGRTAVSLPRLVRLLRQESPDVVVSNSLVVSAGGPAAWAARQPHVWFAHEIGLRGLGARFDLGERRTMRAVARLSRLVLANSETVRAFLEEEPRLRGRVRVVAYAVDTPERERVPGDGPLRLVLVGSLAPNKGQAEAIRAVATLRGQARLRLVGPDDRGHRAELERLVRELGAEVEFAGFVDDPAAELAAADVALTCARDDAFGRVTVEAMKLGVPVVAAASGGTLELVRDGETGLLYPPGHPDELASRVRQLAGDPGLCATLGANARVWARRTFTRERYGAELAAALASSVRT